jgi:hypothetical protein
MQQALVVDALITANQTLMPTAAIVIFDNIAN